STHTTTQTVRLFLFNDPAPTEIYSLSLHDALPILRDRLASASPHTWEWNIHAASRMTKVTERKVLVRDGPAEMCVEMVAAWMFQDRKSTRLNSSHRTISYAVFCLKKKKKKKQSYED